MLKIILRHNLIWLILLFIILPIWLAIFTSLFGPRAIFKWMAHDYRLGGMIQETNPPALNFSHIRNHEVQQFLEKTISEHLPLRSLFIRINNQIYYSIFNKSYMYSGQMVIGKSNQLFEIAYINSYCGKDNRTDEKLIAWADKLQSLSLFFEKKGKTFIYLITPSKAEYFPEKIPDRFACKEKKLTHIERLEKLLKERHIKFVNGSSLVKNSKNTYGVDLFPQGGTHWNNLGAVLVSNAIIAEINKNSTNKIDPIAFDYKVTENPQGQDRDLLWLLNLLHPNDHYPIPELNYKSPSTRNSTINLALIGGSFLEKLIKIFQVNHTFSSIVDYPYFKFRKLKFERDKETETQYSNNSVTQLDSILAADVIILEENSEMTLSEHGELFYSKLNPLLSQKDGHVARLPTLHFNEVH